MEIHAAAERAGLRGRCRSSAARTSASMPWMSTESAIMVAFSAVRVSNRAVRPARRHAAARSSIRECWRCAAGAF